MSKGSLDKDEAVVSLPASDKIISESSLLSLLSFFVLVIGVGSGDILQVFLRSDRSEATSGRIFDQQFCTKSIVGFWSSQVCETVCDQRFNGADSWPCNVQNASSAVVFSNPGSVCESIVKVSGDIVVEGQGILSICNLTSAAYGLSVLLFMVLFCDAFGQLLTVPMIAFTTIPINPKYISWISFSFSLLSVFLSAAIIGVTEELILRAEGTSDVHCDLVYSPGDRACVERGAASIVVYFILLLSIMSTYLCWKRVTWGEDAVGVEALFGVHVPLPVGREVGVSLAPEVLQALPHLSDSRRSLPRRASIRPRKHAAADIENQTPTQRKKLSRNASTSSYRFAEFEDVRRNSEDWRDSDVEYSSDSEEIANNVVFQNAPQKISSDELSKYTTAGSRSVGVWSPQRAEPKENDARVQEARDNSGDASSGYSEGNSSDLYDSSVESGYSEGDYTDEEGASEGDSSDGYSDADSQA